jgi:predicted RNA-binding Zn ribbon-like protein
MKDLSASPHRKGHAGDDDLAIRFVNTRAWRLRDPVEERLASCWALLDWLSATGIAESKDLKVVSRLWKEQPWLAGAVYEFALGVREAIYELLVARIHDVALPERSLIVLNDVLSKPGPSLSAKFLGGRYVWRSRSDDGDVRDLLIPMVHSAVELTTGGRSGKVRQCQDDRGCGWLFVDESRAQNRRWCSMGDCGNRAKARRHYERARQSPT